MRWAHGSKEVEMRLCHKLSRAWSGQGISAQLKIKQVKAGLIRSYQTLLGRCHKMPFMIIKFVGAAILAKRPRGRGIGNSTVQGCFEEASKQANWQRNLHAGGTVLRVGTEHIITSMSLC